MIDFKILLQRINEKYGKCEHKGKLIEEYTQGLI